MLSTVTPRAADPSVRSQLVDAAARLLIEHGPDALTTRRLAGEVGTSTMAVYTHFRGMDELRGALAREGFERLALHLEGVKRTDDPVADLAALGGAYLRNALTNPHLYHFMFVERPEDDPDCGLETFERLVAAVARAVEAGRFAHTDPWDLATQLWAMSHGIVTLHISGLLTFEAAIRVLEQMAINLFVAFGDDRAAAHASTEKGRVRAMESEAQPSPATA